MYLRIALDSHPAKAYSYPMFMMSSYTAPDSTTAELGDVQGVRSQAIEWWARQTLGFHQSDYLTATVGVAYDADLITMTATVVFWME